MIADRLNTVVFNLHQIKHRAFFLASTEMPLIQSTAS